jgi:[ribosomal protein S5]-alanine N-acetyltransferase
VRLEPLALRHAALVLDDLQARALYAYIPDEPPASLEALVARYERYVAGAPAGERWLNWIAFDHDAPVGHVQATVRADRCDVAWLIFARYWRRGYGAAAVRALLAALPRDVAACEASIDPRNIASLALANRVGFVHVGVREDGDVVVARPVREPDEIVAAWRATIAIAGDDDRGAAKCDLVPHVAALARIDPRGVQILADALGDRDGYSFPDPHSPQADNVRRVAADALGRFGALAEPIFAARLADPDRYTRELAVLGLERLPALAPATIDALARMIERDRDVRRAIDRVLARLTSR